MPTLANTISPDWFTDKGCFQPFKEFVKQQELAIQQKFDPQMPVDHLLKEKSVFIGTLHFCQKVVNSSNLKHKHPSGFPDIFLKTSLENG